jgi:hypothetical protein
MRGALRGASWLLAALLWSACGGPVEEEAGGAGDVAAAPQLESQEQAAHTSRIRTRWVRTHDSVDFQQVAFDGSGNLYVALSYRGPVTLTGVALPWNGDPQDYHFGVAKFRPDNTLAWVRGYGPARVSANIAYAHVTGFAVTRAGTVYVGGSAQQDGVRIGGQTLGNGTFLVRLGSDGSLRWARATRPEPNTEFSFVSFAPRPDGGFYALASFRRYAEAISPRLMLIRYGSDGAARWGNIYEQAPATSVYPMRVASDEHGNAYVSGYSIGSAAFGGPAGPTSMNPFVFSTRSTGTHRWTRFPFVAGNGFADGLVARAGRVVVAGFGSEEGAFLLGLTTGSGAPRWRQSLGNVGNVLSLATSTRDEVVLGVASGDAAALGVPRRSPTDNVWNTTSFVARLRRSDGRFVSARNFEARPNGGGASAYAESCAVNDAGTLAASGRFDGTVDFGSGPRSGVESSFVLRAAP